MSEWRQLLLLGDIDELLREVERLAERRDWDRLAGLRRACRAAHETGHQLWPVSDWAGYRLVLEGDVESAGEVLDDPPPVFPVGPLAEVAAQVRTWAELAPHLHDPLATAAFAQERAVRGEPLDELGLDVRLVELPLRLAAWEPAYVLPTYSAAGVDPGEVPFAGLLPCPPLPRGSQRRDPVVVGALEQLVAHRVTAGEVRVRAVAVDGGAEEAAGHLVEASARWAELDADVAVSTWCWHAGGGRRRSGAAAGRVRTWWALAAALDLVDDWPLDPHELGDVLGELRFAAFAPEADQRVVGLAVEDPVHRVAWAVRIDPAPEA